MAEPQDMIMPMLREMREEVRQFRSEAAGNFSDVRNDIASLKDKYKSQYAAMVADTFMSKLITGDFEIRLEALEAELKALKSGH